MWQIDLESWAEFKTAIAEIEAKKLSLEENTKRPMNAVLFRGVGSAAWGLETTLERAYPMELQKPCGNLNAYYELASRGKTSIENLMSHDFGDLLSVPDFYDWMKNAGSIWPWQIFNSNVGIYRYFVHLRHHGYPSPLLDWTASPYIAAFFAFDGMDPSADAVVIHAILRDSSWSSSNSDPHVTILGPYVRAHRRHTVQQSQYSMCLAWDGRWSFRSHDEALKQDGSLGFEGLPIRINIPARERVKALKDLDSMNINSYSLFGSEESLIKTVSRRENLFRS